MIHPNRGLLAFAWRTRARLIELVIKQIADRRANSALPTGVFRVQHLVIPERIRGSRQPLECRQRNLPPRYNTPTIRNRFLIFL